MGMVLIGNDLLSPLLNFGWMGLALLSAWCIGRPFGLAAGHPAGGVLVVDSDMMLVQAGNAPSDIVALACLLAAIAILANGWAAMGARPQRKPQSPGFAIDPGRSPWPRSPAGLAIGTKVTMLVPVGVITIGDRLAGGQPRARAARRVWLGGLLTTGGFWYLRNLDPRRQSAALDHRRPAARAQPGSALPRAGPLDRRVHRRSPRLDSLLLPGARGNPGAALVLRRLRRLRRDRPRRPASPRRVYPYPGAGRRRDPGRPRLQPGSASGPKAAPTALPPTFATPPRGWRSA